MNIIFLKKIIFLPFILIISLQAMKTEEEKIDKGYINLLPNRLLPQIDLYCRINEFKERNEELINNYYVKNTEHWIKGGLYCKTKNKDKLDIHLINSTKKQLNRDRLLEYHDYFLWGSNDVKYNLYKCVIDNYSVVGSHVILHEWYLNCYYILRVNLEKKTQKMMHMTINTLLLSCFSRDKKTLATLEKKADKLQLIIHTLENKKISDNLTSLPYLPHLKEKGCSKWQKIKQFELDFSESQDFQAIEFLDDFNAIALLKNDGVVDVVPLKGKSLIMPEKSSLDRYFKNYS